MFMSVMFPCFHPMVIQLATVFPAGKSLANANMRAKRALLNLFPLILMCVEKEYQQEKETLGNFKFCVREHL